MSDGVKKRLVVYGTLLAVGAILFLLRHEVRELVASIRGRARGDATVEQRLEQYGEAARARWQPYFKEAGVAYPPKELVFVGLKSEDLLEVYAPRSDGSMALIRGLPVCAGSGTNGPKLQEGDFQIPEGIYGISFLNANSRFHLSLRINYPNAFDKKMGERDGRTYLGGDIMIHGACVSIGCLAMGDPAAEDLFVLAADVGMREIKVILAPFDFRLRPPTDADYEGHPDWLPDVYANIQRELQALPTNHLSPE